VRDDWSGVTVCMHVRGYQCTTASMVADLPASGGEPLRVWATLGTACTAVFLPVGVLPAEAGREPRAVVPTVLGDPDAWRSFSALGRRVEAPGEAGAAALAAVRAVLDPIEAAAGEEADALWRGGAGPDAWRADRTSTRL